MKHSMHVIYGRTWVVASMYLCVTDLFSSFQGPFTYDAYPPEHIKFVPLNESKEFTAHEMMEMYSVSDE